MKFSISAADKVCISVLKYMFTEKEEYNVAVSDFAEQLNGEVVDVMDTTRLKYYAIDPGELIYLIENASLVCTDSYHAVLMSMILHKPFIIFDRKTVGDSIMSTRFNTLDYVFGIKHYREPYELTEAQEKLLVNELKMTTDEIHLKAEDLEQAGQFLEEKTLERLKNGSLEESYYVINETILKYVSPQMSRREVRGIL